MTPHTDPAPAQPAVEPIDEVMERLQKLVGDIEQLHAENARLRDELALWKPMTPEEADAAMEAADAKPFSEEEINRIMAKVLDPAYRPTEPEHVQLAAKVKRLTSERDRYRAIVRNAVKHLSMNARRAGKLPFAVVMAHLCMSDPQAARALCAEFGVEADGGETIKESEVGR